MKRYLTLSLLAAGALSLGACVSVKTDKPATRTTTTEQTTLRTSPVVTAPATTTISTY